MSVNLGRVTRSAEWTSGSEELRLAILAQLEEENRIRFPSPRFREDPVAFFREILGVEPWSKQVQIIEAVRDHPRVTVKSGHKVSKSHSAAGTSLWFYSSFEDARVVMTSTTARQVDEILWRELRMMRGRSGRCVDCKHEDPEGRRIPAPCPHSALIDGDLGELAKTGLRSQDFREVVGFTAKQAEAVAGISGKNLLYIVDEASGVPDVIFEAIEGNRAGGARVVLFSNPTRTTGEFYESFNAKAEFYHGVTVSSEETPNVTSGKELIPGLATADWIEEKKREWGEESALYKVRVKGEFAVKEDGKIFSIHAIAESEKRHSSTPDTGRLYIGLDPAGETGSGDETVFAWRRGRKMLGLRAHLGLSEEAHVVHLLALVEEHKLPRERPVVVMDREGPIGAKVYGLLSAFASSPRAPFELVAIRASDRAHRQPLLYDRMRDELAANLESWMRDEGAIVEDAKLAKELHALEWEQAINGRLKLTPKKKLRKLLGRSPDRYDATAMSTWEPLSLQEDVSESAKANTTEPSEYSAATLDPYAGASTWRKQ